MSDTLSGGLIVGTGPLSKWILATKIIPYWFEMREVTKIWPIYIYIDNTIEGSGDAWAQFKIARIFYKSSIN